MRLRRLEHRGVMAAALETPNRERLRPDWRDFLVGGVVN